jgi:hypothetical protein
MISIAGHISATIAQNYSCGAGSAGPSEARDYEAAKATPQPIELWRTQEYGCGGNPRTAEELKTMKTYGYPLQLICPLIDGAAKYVARIDGVRGCGEVRTFESGANSFYLDELDLPPGRYQWSASVYSKEGQLLGDVDVIEPAEIFCIPKATLSAQNRKHVLLDLTHSAGHIRGWGYYNHAQYMITELLQQAGFSVHVNDKSPLTHEKLDGIDLLIVNYYWVGWPGFQVYTQSELAAIREFVSKGGSLFLNGCDRPDGGGKMIEAGNQLAREFGLGFALPGPLKPSARAKVVDEQGIVSFTNPVLIQLPLAVEGSGNALLTLEDIPVATATEYGAGHIIIAGFGMSLLDCYLGDCKNREPFHLLLFYDCISDLTDVDWVMYCRTDFVESILKRCPNLQER